MNDFLSLKNSDDVDNKKRDRENPNTIILFGLFKFKFVCLECLDCSLSFKFVSIQPTLPLNSSEFLLLKFLNVAPDIPNFNASLRAES